MVFEPVWGGKYGDNLYLLLLTFRHLQGYQSGSVTCIECHSALTMCLLATHMLVSLLLWSTPSYHECILYHLKSVFRGSVCTQFL